MSGGDRLDEAWERAEAALPPNWSIHALSIRPGLRPEERWETSAWGRERTDRAYCYGPDPANALRVLAEYLIGLAVGAA